MKGSQLDEILFFGAYTRVRQKSRMDQCCISFHPNTPSLPLKFILETILSLYPDYGKHLYCLSLSHLIHLGRAT